MLKATINLVLWNQENCHIFNSSQKIYETYCWQEENCCQNFAEQKNIVLTWCQNTSNYNCQTENMIPPNKEDYILMGLVISLGSILIIFLICLYIRSKTIGTYQKL